MENPYSAQNNQPQNPNQPQQPMMPRQTDGFAITSMVLGIIAVLSCYFGGIPGIIAVIFGHISLGKFKKSPNLGGKGMAIAGVVCGYIGIAFSIISIIIGIYVASEASKQGSSLMEEIEKIEQHQIKKSSPIEFPESNSGN